MEGHVTSSARYKPTVEKNKQKRKTALPLGKFWELCQPAFRDLWGNFTFLWKWIFEKKKGHFGRNSWRHLTVCKWGIPENMQMSLVDYENCLCDVHFGMLTSNCSIHANELSSPALTYPFVFNMQMRCPWIQSFTYMATLYPAREITTLLINYQLNSGRKKLQIGIIARNF